MPLSRFLTVCAWCRRHQPAERFEPLPDEPDSPAGSISAASTGASSDNTLKLGRVEREVLWVIPSAGGAYFGHEGLEPPRNVQDLRWYCVWDIPGIGRWRVAGLHWGVGPLAYSAILTLHRGEFKGIALRRFETREDAAQAFIDEAEKFDLSPRLNLRVCRAIEDILGLVQTSTPHDEKHLWRACKQTGSRLW